MALIDILNENIIDLEMECSNKDEALKHMAEMLLKAEYIDDVDTFVKDIYEREAEGPTGMGDHIAIPHGKSDAVKKIGIAIGRLKEPIEWESIDEEPINLIFLFCVSNDIEFAKNHMLLLAELAGKLGNEKRILELQKAESKQDIIKLFTI